jgi:hypothetical protein
MQERNIVRRTGVPALKYGILFGILLGAFQVVLTYLTNYLNLGSFAFFITIAGIVVALIVYLLAGIRASQETGRMGTGAFAGLWTGVVSAIIGFLGALLLAYLNLATLRRQAAAAAQSAAHQVHQSIPVTTDQLLISTAVVTGLVGLVFTILLGLIIGAIGGAIGRGRTSRRTVVVEDIPVRDVPTPPPNR